MDSSSSTNVEQVGKVQSDDDHRTRKPDWIDGLLGSIFFRICSSHNKGNNEVNKFCLTCGVSVCKFCISEDHKIHKLIVINRHAAKSVVALACIARDLDCSKIQTFNLNKRTVIALHPLPHLRPRSNDGNKACRICLRKIADPYRYRYCSMSCKLIAFSRKTNPGDPPFLTLKKVTPAEKVSRNKDPVSTVNPGNVVAANQNKEMNSSQAASRAHGSTSFRTRPRKGIPHRAPLF